jgi:hypothetical protein
MMQNEMCVSTMYSYAYIRILFVFQKMGRNAEYSLETEIPTQGVELKLDAYGFVLCMATTYSLNLLFNS